MRKMMIRLLAALLIAALPMTAMAEVVKLPWDESPGLPYQGKFAMDKMVYEDPSIRVERGRVDNKDTDLNCTYYYAYVKIADASQLRTAATNGFDYGIRTKVQVMARRTNAVLAINGDFYGARPETYVLRQGKVYRDSVGENLDVLLIDEDGDFHVILAKDDPASQDKTMVNGKKVVNAFSFGPALIIDDEVVLNKKSSPSLSDPDGRNERMAIVQTGPLEYLVVCVRSVGCDLDEMVQLVQSLTDHVEVAYLLDGGQSTQFVFMGELLNKTLRDCREITDIVYFASAWQPEE